MAQIQTWVETGSESFENFENVEKLNVVFGTLVWDENQQTWRVDNKDHPRQHSPDNANLPKEINGMVWDETTLCWKGNDNILDGLDWGEN